MPTTKKPRIRQAQTDRNPPEVPVRVLETARDAEVGVRVIGAAQPGDAIASAWDAPPLPVDDRANGAPPVSPVFVSDASETESNVARTWSAVPYLTSAVTHAALVLLLAFITFGKEAVEPGVILGVIERDEVIEEETIDDVSMEMPLEFASSSSVSTDLLEKVDAIDEIDVEPPSLDTADRHDTPLQLVPNHDDLWSLAPDRLGNSGKQGGKGSKGSKEGTGSGKGSGGKFAAPSYAVRKGSFAAWTVPKDPHPLKPYKIIIQVTLPTHLKKYSPDDLKGRVEGTDGYSQRIPQPEAKPPTRQELEEMIDSGNVRLGNGGASGDRMARSGRPGGEERMMLKQLLRQGRLKISQPRGGTFDFRNGIARLSVTVPGARNRVEDRIEIRSKILDERQVLEIEF